MSEVLRSPLFGAALLIIAIFGAIHQHETSGLDRWGFAMITGISAFVLAYWLLWAGK